MNKKGAEKVLSVYWFIILLIVTGAIVYMVYSFYGTPYNIREIEKSILMNSVADCLVQKGYLFEDVLGSGENALSQQNFLERCHLKFSFSESSDIKEAEQYFVGVEIFEANSLEEYFKNFDSSGDVKSDLTSAQNEVNGVVRGEPIKEIFVGNFNLRSIGALEQNSQRNSRILYALSEEGHFYLIKISAVVGNFKKNE